jgi:hypothetical protein
VSENACYTYENENSNGSVYRAVANCLQNDFFFAILPYFLVSVFTYFKFRSIFATVKSTNIKLPLPKLLFLIYLKMHGKMLQIRIVKEISFSVVYRSFLQSGIFINTGLKIDLNFRQGRGYSGPI